MTDKIPIARPEALILEPEGPPTLGLDAARVLARIIRANRDQTGSIPPQTEADNLAKCRPGEGHSAA